MKLQDFFPFHETIVGLDGIYHTTPDGFFVNSSCIQSEYGIIKLNQLFLLQIFDEDLSNDIELVRLLDVFYYEGDVCLYLLDIVTQQTKIITHRIDKGYLDINWKLIEINFLMELLKNGYEFTLQPNTSDLDSGII